MNWISLLFYVLLMGSAFILTGLIRKHAATINLIDIPNQRSSHQIVTPRGGGLSFVICFAMAQCFLFKSGVLSLTVFLIFFVPPLLVATLGLLDDLGGLSAKIRLLSHFIIVFMALYWLGGTQVLSAMPHSTGFIILMNILIAFLLAWSINLYNFMDGIDGLAALNAVVVSFSAALFFLISHRYDLSLVALSIMFSVSGFLLWNFPNAKIFMGDVGSGFLGLVIGLLTLSAAQINSDLMFAMLIMNAVFIVDTGLTLCVRCIRCQNVSQAHRTHAYQHATMFLGRHQPVTLIVFLMNVFFLLPLALLCIYHLLTPWIALIFAYVPLLFLANRLRAGRCERQ